MKDLILSYLKDNNSVFIVNLKNLAYNYNYITKKIPNSLIFPAIKANAYGLGAKEVASCLIKQGCKGLFVFNNEEAIQIHSNDNNVKIYTLGGEINNLELYKKYKNIIPVLYSKQQLDKWTENKNHKPFAVQVETGLNRQGLEEKHLLQKINETNSLNLDMVMSHLACATTPESSYNKVQLKKFQDIVNKIPSNIKTSLSATYSMFTGNEYNFNIIRPGIALFGGKPILKAKTQIQPVAYLYGKILQLRNLKKGEKSGYNATTAKENTTIAIVSIGYADGVLRSSSNGKSYMNINGYKAPIFGTVSMDTTIIDVNNVPKELLYVGKEVEFYGEFTKINDIANTLNDNPCNIITNAGLRSKRIYID